MKPLQMSKFGSVKRFSFREFALVCSPLVLFGMVGWLLSQRKAPAPQQPLHLTFHIDNPTVLEAFDGVDAALVVELKGRGADKWNINQTAPFLELDTPAGTQTSHNNSPRGAWEKVWKNNINGTRLLLNSQVAPKGKMRFGINAKISPQSGTLLSQLSRKWEVDRAKIKPFAFGVLPRTPMVVLRSMKITSVPTKANSQVSGEAVFDFVSPGANKNTSFESSFSHQGGNGGMGWGSGGTKAGLTPETGRRRVREWTVFHVSKGKIRVSGRVSANNLWPLAFQSEPFDLAKIKVGQTLKFKTRPAPVPAKTP